MKIRRLSLLESYQTSLTIDSPCYCVRSLFLQYADQNLIYNFAWSVRFFFCHLGEYVKIGWF